MTEQALGLETKSDRVTGDFVPDEELSKNALEERYARLSAQLESHFGMGAALATYVATRWQPSALEANLARGEALRNWCRGTEAHWRLLMPLAPQYPELPANTTLAIAQRLNADPVVVGIREGRQALFMAAEDCVPVLPTEWALQRLGKDLVGLHGEKTVPTLSKVFSRPGSFTVPPESVARLTSPAARLQIAEPGLKGPLPEKEISTQFSAQFPWSAKDYPGCPARSTSVFWAHRYGHLKLQAALRGGDLLIAAYNEQSRAEHAWVQVDQGGIRRMTEEFGKPIKPGYYLVKYGNQPRGGRPLPGVDAAMAADIHRRTGLETDEPEYLHQGWAFYASEAGFALAKWAARYPTRLKEGPGRFHKCKGPALERMKFELERC